MVTNYGSMGGDNRSTQLTLDQSHFEGIFIQYSLVGVGMTPSSESKNDPLCDYSSVSTVGETPGSKYIIQYPYIFSRYSHFLLRADSP